MEDNLRRDLIIVVLKKLTEILMLVRIIPESTDPVLPSMARWGRF